jgi:hypothetical protein
MGNSIFKKLLFDKKFTDIAPGQKIAEYKINPWKLFAILIASAVLLIIIYGLFFVQPAGKGDFFGSIIFYAIVIIVAIAAIWIICMKALDFKKIIYGFFISFVLILVLYWILGAILGFFNILKFQMGGYTLWIMITILAGLGAKRIDGDLDKKDVGFGLVAFLVILGVNLPIVNGQGFLYLLDTNVFSWIIKAIGLAFH